nr:LysM peptidoglycan-binding domain-containing protein [Spirochaetota bacterium]
MHSKIAITTLLLLISGVICAQQQNIASNKRPSGIKASYLKSKGLSTEKTKKPAPAPKKSVKLATVSKKNYLIHRVKKGENLTKIAKRYKTTPKKILAINKLKNPNKLFVGSHIRIPRSSVSSGQKTGRTTSKSVDNLRFIWPARPVAR